MRDIVFRTIMLKGASGNDIVSIEKTSTQGAVDTYTITLSDGSTETFNVTNGTSIASIEKTSTSGLIDTYTITLTDGSTSTFEVANGENAQVYEIPKDSVIGFDSEDATPAGYNEISSPYDAALSATSDNAIQNKAVKAAIDALIDATQFKAGDTLSLNGAIFAGALSGSSKDLYFFIPLPKGTANISSVAISGNWLIRAAGANVINNATLASQGTVSYSLVAGGVQVKVVLDTASSVATNSVVSAYGYTGAKLTFS